VITTLHEALVSDSEPMVALAASRTDVKSFSLTHPIVDAASRFEVTAFAALTLAALGIWLLVLPLEFLKFLGA
jgi:hypothetical protein